MSFYCKRVAMKCFVFDATKRDNATMEKTAAAAEESRVLQLKPPPAGDTSPTKPQSSSKELSLVLFSAKNNTSASQDKENNTSGDPATVDDCFEDSGYLSLQNSHIDLEGEDQRTLGKQTAALQENTALSNKSPSKCQGKAKAGCLLSLVVATTPVAHLNRKTTRALSSTPSSQHSHSSLPILKFEQDACEELANSFKKNKKYDFSIIQEVADKHHLDRVIGRHMGLEYVDVFTFLLFRNMKIILSNILGLLGDLDLISCKKVSKTWGRIICDDRAAFKRLQQAEQQLMESSSSLRQQSCGLTRDVAKSRVVLSCMQTVASSCTPSSSGQSCRITTRRSATPQNSSFSRHNEFTQAVGGLKRDQPLYKCSHCGSPAIDFQKDQKATCTRPSCLFEFCTCCKEAFHGSAPCRTLQPKPHVTTNKLSSNHPGSALSKRRIKRL